MSKSVVSKRAVSKRGASSKRATSKRVAAIGATSSGDVLGERTFRFTDRRGRTRSVRAVVGQPAQRDSGAWSCTYRIVGLGPRRVEVVYGLDAIEAIARALATLRNDVTTRARDGAGAVSWHRSDDVLGLPGDPRPTARPSTSWPAQAGAPRPRIPRAAVERVAAVHASGAAARTRYFVGHALVGEASWDETGALVYAFGVRGGRREGYAIEYDDGRVTYAEPFRDGKQHGWAKQYDERGRLVVECPFKDGTGIDYWCNRGRLAEEHPHVNGASSGVERWWNDDQRSVWIERTWRADRLHGVEREWNGARLAAGFPKYYVAGELVPRAAYLRAAARDATLPALTKADDASRRMLPAAFTRLRARVRVKASRD